MSPMPTPCAGDGELPQGLAAEHKHGSQEQVMD